MLIKIKFMMSLKCLIKNSTLLRSIIDWILVFAKCIDKAIKYQKSGFYSNNSNNKTWAVLLPFLL